MSNTLGVTISNVAADVQVGSVSIEGNVDNRSVAQCVVNDVGVSYQHGQPFVITDTVLGVLYTGFIASAAPSRETATTHKTWAIIGKDLMWLAEKRLNFKNYINRTTGDIVADMVASILVAEGVQLSYVSRYTTTQADFAAGTLSGVAAALSVGDGDLELANVGAYTIKTYNSQNDWVAGGAFAGAASCTPSGIAFIPQTARDWNNGDKSNQFLYGYGNPQDDASGGTYQLHCDATQEVRSLLYFAGVWGPSFTVQTDIRLIAGAFKFGFCYLTSGLSNNDGSYAYAIEMTTAYITLRKGTNGGGNNSSQIAVANFSTNLAVGNYYTVSVTVSAGTHNVYVNGALVFSIYDNTYTAPGYILLRNRNIYSSGVWQNFDNFGVSSGTSGQWTSATTTLNMAVVANSAITWDTSNSTGGTVSVFASISGGPYQQCTSGGNIPGLPKGTAGTGKTVTLLVTFTSPNALVTPTIKNLTWIVIGGYTTTGIWTNVPLVLDYMNRANQIGLGTGTNGNTYTKLGTSTDGILNQIAYMINGNASQVTGPNTITDAESNIEFILSSSAMTFGMQLRYVDGNNYYYLSVTTTTINIYKATYGVLTRMATAPITVLINTWYRMRFQVFGYGPAYLNGRVWLTGTKEPLPWSIQARD